MRGLGQVVWSSSNSATLIAIPFFVLLGEILVRCGVAARTYAALNKWVSWLPGGLIHANIGVLILGWIVYLSNNFFQMVYNEHLCLQRNSS